MKFSEFNALVGGDSYVRCKDKKRIDTAIVTAGAARKHLKSRGSIGWWVKSGYIIVDIDEGKEEALRVVKKLGLKTLMSKTPKGLHLYFKTDKDFPQRVGMILPFGLKCDYRCANKGYVILPFARKDRTFNNSNIVAELPPEFTPIPNRKDSLLGLKEGDGRNATLFSHLMSYKNRGAKDDDIQKMAETINSIIFDEPMDETELYKIVDNTKNYKASEFGENPYLIYSSKGKATQVNNRSIVDYFVNSGNVFAIGGECYQFFNGRYIEASSNVRNTIKEMIGVDHLITQSRIMECYRLLTDDIRVQKDVRELNRDKNLINFNNGVWDIDNMTLIPHDSKYLQTLQINHDVNPVDKILEETKLYDFLINKAQLSKDSIDMCLRYMAYCLTLDYGLKTFMILFGPSNTGKSVLIRFFETLVGLPNVSSLSMHELNKRFYPTQLYDKLLNSCADNSSMALSSIDSLKKITGGDQIMYEKKGNPNIFFFTSFAKLLFSFNQMPLQLEEKSNAFYKRMRVLPLMRELYLNNGYVNSLCSKESIEEIIPHLLVLLPLNEIPTTKVSDDIVESLRQDSDSVHAFIETACVIGKNRRAVKSEFYDNYARYCLETGREAHKKHSFTRHMKTSGYKDGRHPKSREAVWLGIKIKSSWRV